MGSHSPTTAINMFKLFVFFAVVDMEDLVADTEDPDLVADTEVSVADMEDPVSVVDTEDAVADMEGLDSVVDTEDAVAATEDVVADTEVTAVDEVLHGEVASPNLS